MNIANNINQFNHYLTDTSCRLVAVSKTKPVALVQQAYDAGQRIFGENKVQELAEKHELLPEDIQWHMIGHLQRNKVKYLAPFVTLIHAVDSLRLLTEINKQGQKNEKVINCLLQMHIAEEETKFGLSEEELKSIIDSPEIRTYDHINIAGLMGMATNTNDEDQVRKEFRHLKHLFDMYSKLDFGPNVDFKELSMGMSGDYKIALEEGSTLIRVGSSIFGARNYTS